MDPKYIFDNLVSRDYNNIIDNIYDDLPRILLHLEQHHDFSPHLVKGSIDLLVSSLTGFPAYETEWLQVTREIVIFLARKLRALVIDDEGNKVSTIRVDTEHKIRLMLLYMIFYHYDARGTQTKRLYSGVDFEFNDRKIALCQVGFYPHRRNKFIWVFDPNSLTNEYAGHLIKYLFTSQFIFKIVHGSDSLDIPYLFQELFVNNHDLIYSFVTNVIDTRFLCEYHKNTLNDGKKCSLYDALLYFGTIDQAQYSNLEKINKAMGKIWLMTWNVYKMNLPSLQYALYDVFYLRDFYFDMLEKAWDETPDLYNSYEYIPLITRFIFLEKWNVSDLLARIKPQVDTINNYIVWERIPEQSPEQSPEQRPEQSPERGQDRSDNVTMNVVFQSVIKDMVIQGPKLKLRVNDLLDINYFRTPLMLLFKMIVYSIITDNYEVYKNKDEAFTGKLDLVDVFETFKLIKMEKLRTLVKRFHNEATGRVTRFLEKN